MVGIGRARNGVAGKEGRGKERMGEARQGRRGSKKVSSLRMRG